MAYSRVCSLARLAELTDELRERRIRCFDMNGSGSHFEERLAVLHAHGSESRCRRQERAEIPRMTDSKWRVSETV